MSFDYLTADDFGGVSGEVSPDPSLQSTPYSLLYPPTPYSLPPTPISTSMPGTPMEFRQMSATSRAKRLQGRLLSPDSSPPVRCPRQRCALLPKQKNIRARGGWRRMKDSGGRGAPRPLI